MIGDKKMLKKNWKKMKKKNQKIGGDCFLQDYLLGEISVIFREISLMRITFFFLLFLIPVSEFEIHIFPFWKTQLVHRNKLFDKIEVLFASYFFHTFFSDFFTKNHKNQTEKVDK